MNEYNISVLNWIWINELHTWMDGWKMRPSGSWPKAFLNLSSSNFLAIVTSQKLFSRTLNGSRILFINPRWIALLRGSASTWYQMYFYLTISNLQNRTYNIFFDTLYPTEKCIRKKFVFHVACTVVAHDIVYQIPVKKDMNHLMFESV